MAVRPVVVGVDGSASAYRAVEWAAAEAHRRGVGLRLVRAFSWTTADHPTGWVAQYRDEMLEFARQVARAARVAADTRSGIDTESHVEIGAPIEVLSSEARRAQLLVLGDRGLGEVGRLVLGSVAVSFAASGACPVVVVRGERGTPTVPWSWGSTARRSARPRWGSRSTPPRPAGWTWWPAHVVADRDRRGVGAVGRLGRVRRERRPRRAVVRVGAEVPAGHRAADRGARRRGAGAGDASRARSWWWSGPAVAATRRACCSARSATASCTPPTARSPSSAPAPTADHRGSGGATVVRSWWPISMWPVIHWVSAIQLELSEPDQAGPATSRTARVSAWAM